MSNIVTLSNPEQELAGKAALVLLSNGEGLRSDFSAMFKKSAAEQSDILFAQVNPADHPAFAERFNVNSKPVLVAWYKGDLVVRKPRPWGSDVQMAIEDLKTAMAADQPEEVEQQLTETEENQTMSNANNAPVHVTGETFQKDVVDYDLPVLVDFWAEWCGPCRMVAPILDQLAKDYAGKIRIAKVDVDQPENQALSQQFGIRSIPTIMAFKDRHLVFSQPGAFPEAAFRDLIEQLIKLEIPEHDEEEEAAPESE